MNAAAATNDYSAPNSLFAKVLGAESHRAYLHALSILLGILPGDMAETDTPEESLKLENLKCFRATWGVGAAEMAGINPAIHVNGGMELPAAGQAGLYRVARVCALAVVIFDNSEKARSWVKSPKQFLSGRSPMACCSTEAGAELVVERLISIGEGLAL